MGGRAPCCDKNKVKRGSWSHAEDQKLISFISQHGHGNWRALPRLAGEDPEISKEVPGDNEVVLFESDPDFWNRLDDLGNSSSIQEIDRLLDLDDHLDAALGDPGIIYEAMAVSHDQWVHYLEDALGLLEPARTEDGHQNLNDASTQPLL
ncbi:hypothetical protein SAY86_003269 [Trapa natans]|uniref:Uncharacterized protein n=1 Tax=Trapa natans TaxID=22666 RepID=A0AAN7MRL3_TRANT|nr:hypothetical protein SAY86_003269 [Trapa natans]